MARMAELADSFPGNRKIANHINNVNDLRGRFWARSESLTTSQSYGG